MPVLCLTMVHMVEHTIRADDAEMGEGEASSAPRASRHPAPGATLPAARPREASVPTARYCTSGRPSRAPSQAASSGPLAAARELLCNPPAAVASPDTLRQWRDDVDRLLHLAQAAPGSARTGPRPPPGNALVLHQRRQDRASASVHSPTVRSARTEDQRAELNHGRAARMPASPSTP